MERTEQKQPLLETDPRFPSGAWMGFYHQLGMQSRQHLALSFSGGRVEGEGRDPAGSFRVSGIYQLDTGVCRLVKSYGEYRVEYDGLADGEAISGGWLIRYAGIPMDRGVFRIWPDDLDSERERLREEVVVPVSMAT